MLTCRDISEKATEQMEGELGFFARVQFRLHLLICVACRRFYRQFKLTADVISVLTGGTGEDGEPTQAQVDSILNKINKNN